MRNAALADASAAASAFLGLAADIAPAESEALRGLRAAGRTAFERLGLPSPGEEEWRKTNLAPLLAARFRLPPALREAPSQEELGRALFGLDRAPRLVFLDGRLVRELSAGTLPRGIRAGAPSREPFGRIASADREPFTALNGALASEAAVLDVAPGADAAEPVVLLFLQSAGAAPAVTAPRVLLRAGAGSRARVVEIHASLGEAAHFTDSVTEIEIGANASLAHALVGAVAPRALHLARVAAAQERDSRFFSHAVLLGGRLTRADISVGLSGEGAECELTGLFAARGEQQLDLHTRIEHRCPHARSRELYKGILDGRSRGVFHGLTVVGEGARKTDAQQTNKNLLLSREALVDSTPQLLIHNDDVRCGHGSTTGQIDENAVFYLRSRGLSEKGARAALTRAFVRDVLERAPVPELAGRIERELDARFFSGEEAP